MFFSCLVSLFSILFFLKRTMDRSDLPQESGQMDLNFIKEKS